jgi:hypothetical protein
MRPEWVNIPKIEDIVKRLRSLFHMKLEEQLRVSLLGAGAMNRAYLVTTRRNQFVLRISLPMDPGYKTRGEVATLNFLERYTRLNVPVVENYSDSFDDQVGGFEWILETKVEGDTAFNKWRQMSMSQKKNLVLEIVDCQQQIMKQQFDTIGTLKQMGKEFVPGRLVAREFCFGDYLFHDVPRGPFVCTRDWFSALTKIIILDYNRVIDNPGEDDDVEDAEYYLDVTQRLHNLIPTLFPTTSEPTVLWHHDLSLRNIMLNGQDSLSGIIDWEFVSAMPMWVATQPPAFLRGRDRKRKPDPENYDDPDAPSKDRYGRDNHGKSDGYWMNLLEYEQTVLRDLYNGEMSDCIPGWGECLEKSTLEVDFLKAISLCRNASWGGPVHDWIDELEEGNVIRLRYGRRKDYVPQTISLNYTLVCASFSLMQNL